MNILHLYLNTDIIRNPDRRRGSSIYSVRGLLAMLLSVKTFETRHKLGLYWYNSIVTVNSKVYCGYCESLTGFKSVELAVYKDVFGRIRETFGSNVSHS